MYTFKNFRNVFWHGKTHSAMHMKIVCNQIVRTSASRKDQLVPHHFHPHLALNINIFLANFNMIVMVVGVSPQWAGAPSVPQALCMGPWGHFPGGRVLKRSLLNICRTSAFSTKGVPNCTCCIFVPFQLLTLIDYLYLLDSPDFVPGASQQWDIWDICW